MKGPINGSCPRIRLCLSGDSRRIEGHEREFGSDEYRRSERENHAQGKENYVAHRRVHGTTSIMRPILNGSMAASNS